MTNQQSNPLKGYFRQVKHYVALPSNKFDYNKEVIEFTNDRKEVGIKAMTGVDEITLRNPDALLNGEATVSLIKSCIPEIKSPKDLLINDINALMVAIKYATSGPEHSVKGVCPACETENHYSLNLENLLSDMSMLANEYVVPVGDLKIFISPHTYESQMKAMALGFEEAKSMRILESNNLDDGERIKAFSNSIRRVGNLNFDLLTMSVLKIVLPDGQEVTNKGFIKELMVDLDQTEYKKILAQIEEINKVGIKNTVEATCESCQHKWDLGLSFVATDFFTDI